MTISNWFFRLGVIAALIGMTLGVWMGKAGDFTLSPVHAHINLLGWVSMLLYGLFYRAFPVAAATKLAAAHFWINVLGVIVMVASLALYLSGHTQAAPILGVSGIIVALSMVIFAVIVFRATGSKTQAA
ncbi:hypothetical protein Q0812_03095 [Brevundimonas sp. 2R-24]|uniref:Cytochrome-c oxidase n=1 Tax=Peiella sedimenti TaxID=3061083 RepID=A0ABT8SIW0_9CAUL|nr:hypothetical protein [Caulobacteraceae bacterium XZ-24]